MSRVEELENEIKGLENRRLELLKQLELEKLTEEFEHPLKMNDTYYVIDLDGEIVDNWWGNDNWDKKMSLIGNFFYSKQEAEKELDRRILSTRFRRFRDKCNGDWKPKLRELKYYIFLNCTDFNCSVSYDTVCNAFNLFGYFKHKTDCKRAIELFGDEIKRLWVEE